MPRSDTLDEILNKITKEGQKRKNPLTGQIQYITPELATTISNPNIIIGTNPLDPTINLYIICKATKEYLTKIAKCFLHIDPVNLSAIVISNMAHNFPYYREDMSLKNLTDIMQQHLESISHFKTVNQSFFAPNGESIDQQALPIQLAENVLKTMKVFLETRYRYTTGLENSTGVNPLLTTPDIFEEYRNSLVKSPSPATSPECDSETIQPRSTPEFSTGPAPEAQIPSEQPTSYVRKLNPAAQNFVPLQKGYASKPTVVASFNVPTPTSHSPCMYYGQSNTGPRTSNAQSSTLAEQELTPFKRQ